MLRKKTSGKEPEEEKTKQEKQDSLRNIEKKDKKEMNRHRETRADCNLCHEISRSRKESKSEKCI